MRKLLASLSLVATMPFVTLAVSGPQILANDAAVAYANTYTQNLQQYGSPQGVASKLSMQVTVASATVAGQSFTGGTQSTGSLTVVSTVTLVAATASDSITVPSTAAILGTPATNQITIISLTGMSGLNALFTTSLQNYSDIAASSPTLILNGQEFYTYAGTWASTDTIQHAAATLVTAINTNSLVYRASVVSSTGVAITLISSGTFANGYSVNSSKLTDISTGTFSGGADPVTIAINNTQQILKYTYGGNWASSDTVNHAAATLALAITATGGNDLIVANAGAAVVYASATVVGPSGNSFTITTSSASRVSVSSSSFLGGVAPALLNAAFIINGSSYKNGKHWTDVSGTSTGTALSITNFINSISTTGAICGGGPENIIATQAGGVVNLKTATSCTGNNAITLTASPTSGGLTAGSPTFTGGQDNASITINGTKLTIGTDIPPLTISSTTANLATSIAATINANAALSPLINSVASGAVVYSTSDNVGAGTNYTTVSSTQSQLSFSNPTMTGGTNSGYSIATDLITIPNHGFTKALPVLYLGSPAIGGLTTTTTYYAVVIDVNNIGLSSTSVVALTGKYIDLTSSTAVTTANTYTLTPSTFIAGSAGGSWQVSNDCTNGPWSTYSTTSGGAAVATQSFSVSGSSTTVQDFGIIDYGCLRYVTVAPTQGEVSLKVILNAKD